MIEHADETSAVHYAGVDAGAHCYAHSQLSAAVSAAFMSAGLWPA